MLIEYSFIFFFTIIIFIFPHIMLVLCRALALKSIGGMWYYLIWHKDKLEIIWLIVCGCNTSDLWLPYVLLWIVQCNHSEMWHGRKKNLSCIFLLLWSWSDSLLTESMPPVTLSTHYCLKKAQKLLQWNCNLHNILTVVWCIWSNPSVHSVYSCIQLVLHWSQARLQAQEENK